MNSLGIFFFKKKDYESDLPDGKVAILNILNPMRYFLLINTLPSDFNLHMLICEKWVALQRSPDRKKEQVNLDRYSGFKLYARCVQASLHASQSSIMRCKMAAGGGELSWRKMWEGNPLSFPAKRILLPSQPKGQSLAPAITDA